MSSFTNEIYKISSDIKKQFSGTDVSLPLLTLKVLELVNHIQGLKPQDKKNVVIDVIVDIVDDMDILDPVLPLIRELLDKLIEFDEKGIKITDRSRCRCNCFEVVSCKMSAFLPTNPFMPK